MPTGLRYPFQLLLLAVGVFSVLESNCREIKWSLELTESRRYPYLLLLGSGADGFHVVRSDAPLLEGVEKEDPRAQRFLLQYFSDNMSLSWEREISCPIPEGRIFHFGSAGNRILVLFSNRRLGADIRDIYAQYLDSKGAFEGIPVLIDEVSLERIDLDRLPAFSASKDRSKWGICYRMNDRSPDSHLACFVGVDSALNVIYRKEVVLPGPFKRYSPEHTVMMNDGGFYLLGRKYLTDKRVKSPEECHYVLNGYDPNSDESPVIDIRLTGKYLTDANLASDEFNHQLAVAGFYSETGMNTSAGIFMWSLSKDSAATTSAHFAPFTNDVLIRSAADRIDFRQKELFNYYVDRLLLRKDGGVAVIAESYVENIRTFWDFYTQTTISHTYYRFGNILAASLEPDGSLAWNISIQKEQTSMDDDGNQSSYCDMISGGTYFTVYNKYIDRRSSVMLSKIDGTGQTDTETLFGESERVVILPASARQIRSDAMVIPAYRQGKLRLLRITLP